MGAKEIWRIMSRVKKCMVVASNVWIKKKSRCFLQTTVGKNIDACLSEAGFALTKLQILGVELNFPQSQKKVKTIPVQQIS